MTRRRTRSRRRRRSTAIDAALAERLLAAALGSGGDYADLYFEYRSGADFVLEDGRVRTVGRGVTLGLGVRVLRATPPATPTPRSCPRSACSRRRARRRRSPPAARAPGPDRGRAGARCPTSTRSPSRRWRARAPTSSSCSGAPTRRRAPSDPRIVRVEASLRRGVQGGPGRHLRRHAGARSPAADPLRRARGRRGGRQAPGRPLGRRRAASAWSTSRARAEPRGARPRGGAAGDRHARRRRGAGRADGGRARRRATPASCCTRRSATASRPTSTASETSNYTGQIGKPVASPLCTVVDDGTIDNARGVDQRRRRGQRRRSATCSSRTASWSATCRTGSRPSTSAPTPSGNGRRQSFRHEPLPRMTNTFLRAGQRRSRGDHPVGQARRLRQALLRRAGQHLERRLRLLADRELPHRGRQAHRAAQGREPDRQRARRAAQGDDARQRLRAVATGSGPAARTASRCRSASARRP